MDTITSHPLTAVGLVAVGIATLVWLRSSKPKAAETWASHVFPHSSLQTISEHLYVVKGTLPRAPPRNMTICVLSADSTKNLPLSSSPSTSPRRARKKKEDSSRSALLVHSCIAVNEETLVQIEALGDPRVLVVPNAMHRADAAVWKTRFPSLLVLCPRKAAEKVKEVVALDGFCEDVLPSCGVRVLEPRGLSAGELVYSFPIEVEERARLVPASAYILTDLLFNLGADAGFIPRLLGSTGDGETPKVTSLFLRMAVSDKKAFREWFQRELVDQASDLDLAVVAHGNVVRGGFRKKMQTAIAAV